MNIISIFFFYSYFHLPLRWNKLPFKRDIIICYTNTIIGITKSIPIYGQIGIETKYSFLFLIFGY